MGCCCCCLSSPLDDAPRRRNILNQVKTDRETPDNVTIEENYMDTPDGRSIFTKCILPKPGIKINGLILYHIGYGCMFKNTQQNIFLFALFCFFLFCFLFCCFSNVLNTQNNSNSRKYSPPGRLRLGTTWIHIFYARILWVWKKRWIMGNECAYTHINTHTKKNIFNVFVFLSFLYFVFLFFFFKKT